MGLSPRSVGRFSKDGKEERLPVEYEERTGVGVLKRFVQGGIFAAAFRSDRATALHDDSDDSGLFTRRVRVEQEYM